MRSIIVLSAIAMTGCAAMPESARVELEHVSHPMVGWPVDKQSEYGLTHVNAVFRWNVGGITLDNGLGYNLDDSGFPGPKLTYTARVGKEWRFKK